MVRKIIVFCSILLVVLINGYGQKEGIINDTTLVLNNEHHIIRQKEEIKKNDTIHIQSYPKILLKFNPFSLFLETCNIQFETVINKHTSFQIGLSYTSFSYDNDGDVNTNQGFWIKIDMRNYIFLAAPKGLYFSPFIGIYKFSENDNYSKSDNPTVPSLNGSALGIGFGFVLGYQFVTKSNFSFDLFIGPSYYTIISSSGEEFFGYPFNNFVLRTGFTIGIPIK